MTATLWISGRVCRAIVRDADGHPIDLVDEWNNIASTQSYLFDAYPEAKQTTIRDRTQTRELDRQWNSYKNGNG